MNKVVVVGLAVVLGACAGEKPVGSPQVVSGASARRPVGNVYPATARKGVTDTYFGTAVVDEYRWLEDSKNADVKAWTEAQNAFTRSRLDPIGDRAKIRERIAGLLSGRPPKYFDVVVRGDKVFALKEQPPKQQPFLVVFGDVTDAKTERVVLDPNVVDASGKTTIDFYEPSRDGARVAVSLSVGGTESGDVHVYDAAGKATSDVVPRVNGGTAGGSVAWNPDGSGFFYTRYPHDGERPAADLDFYQQVFFHRVGQPVSSDVYAMGKELPRIAETFLEPSDDGKTVLAVVANGDGGEFAMYALDASAVGSTPVQIARFEDKLVPPARFGPDGSLYVVSHKTTPKGSILRFKKPFASSKPEVVVPEGDGVIQRFIATQSQLYVTELLGGPSRLRGISLAAPAKAEVIDVAFKIPSIQSVVRTRSDDFLYYAESYTDAPGWFRFDAKTKKSIPTVLSQPMPYPMDDVEVVRDECVSKDGTKVPLNVLRKRGLVLDGSHPVLLNGYGGYGVSRTPKLRPMNRLWLDQGGVFAEANLRGGGELGEAWHEAGKLANKQNVFDDFYACARTLVEKKYTQPAKLAIIGGSNGGLLMGAAFVQHPEMYRAVVSEVGIYDMLRVETTPNGAFNVTEFGTVKDEKLFRALFAYSPLHNVKDGTRYPSILFTTGANDPRVDPYNSRKMTARLQAATAATDHPILLRASGDTGHGMGTPLATEIEEETDIYAFLMHELAMPFVK